MDILWIKILAGVAGMAALGAFGGFLVQGIDRKLVALMQARIGPPIRQPYWDFLKLMGKENVVPEHAVAPIFNAAPVVSFAAVVTLLLYLPLFGQDPVLEGYGDLILVMYLLAMPALALVFGGFASGSPYATVGAQREMVTMIAYELPLGAVVVAIAWKLGAIGVAEPFSLAAVTANPVWNACGPFGWGGFFLLLLALVLVTPAELGKVPFDAPEAKSELAEGLLVEYSGRNLALFHLSLGARMIAMTALTVALFVPYNLSPALALNGVAGAVVDAAFFAAKFFIVMFLSIVLMRAAMARFRINQVVEVYWKIGGALTGLGLLLVMFDHAIRTGG